MIGVRERSNHAPYTTDRLADRQRKRGKDEGGGMRLGLGRGATTPPCSLELEIKIIAWPLSQKEKGTFT